MWFSHIVYKFHFKPSLCNIISAAVWYSIITTIVGWRIPVSVIIYADCRPSFPRVGRSDSSLYRTQSILRPSIRMLSLSPSLYYNVYKSWYILYYNVITLSCWRLLRSAWHIVSLAIYGDETLLPSLTGLIKLTTSFY